MRSAHRNRAVLLRRGVAPKVAVALAISGWVSVSFGASSHDLSRLLRQGPEWFASAPAGAIGSNIVSFQSEHGGWPKNTDTHSRPYGGKRSDLHPTFDNGATVDELRFLARLCSAHPGGPFRQSFDKGYSYLLEAQYANGGFPQSYPFRATGYERHITFNDGSMVRVLRLLREISNDPVYQFLPGSERQRAGEAFRKGIGCILRCQVRQKGQLTAWCAQHDATDLSPARARTYELPSLSGAESTEIVRLLMSLPQPDASVVEAVEGAIKWFRAVQIQGIKVVLAPDPKSPKGTDKRVVEDPTAPALWARFYDLETNQPFFCDRDGIPKRHLSEIGYERRNGYSWLGSWPAELIEKEYPGWARRR